MYEPGTKVRIIPVPGWNHGPDAVILEPFAHLGQVMTVANRSQTQQSDLATHMLGKPIFWIYCHDGEESLPSVPFLDAEIEPLAKDEGIDADKEMAGKKEG